MNVRIEDPWLKSWEEVCRSLNVSVGNGLDTREYQERLRHFGPNRLREAQKKSAMIIFLDQWKNIIVLLLFSAAVLSFSFGQWLEGTAVLAAILLNVLIGFITELKAVRSLESLRQMRQTKAKVRRDGRLRKTRAADLVPGDIVSFEGGDIVSADLRLVEASNLRADESALTGESVPAGKDVVALDNDAPVAERTNMLFKGSTVTTGSGHGVVTATGMETELGRIVSLAEEAQAETSPLEKRLNRLGRRLVWVTVVIAVLVAIGGIMAGEKVLLIVETSIALAVAAIPEGLPIVATIALAKGMWRMARHNALMNRLSAVETLGGASVICTDKTGTLTQNQLTVTSLDLAESSTGNPETFNLRVSGHASAEEDSKHDYFVKALEIGVLCNNAQLDEKQPFNLDRAVGDPLEIALLAAGHAYGVNRQDLLDKNPEAREVAFDRETKMMATYHQTENGWLVAVKGAPGAVLEASTSWRDGENDRGLDPNLKHKWSVRNQTQAENGLRVLALGMKTVAEAEADPYENLTFAGLVSMIDPPRPEVDQAIEKCRRAGIKVVMVTGDHPATALKIGRDLNLVGDDGVKVIHSQDLPGPEDLADRDRERILHATVFARVSPKQKLDLIEVYQKNGNIVAMTGDGINDTPAIKKADIGIAMGRRGTQAAREAADMVLLDDSFSTIVTAVEQGRTIFENIRKFMIYLLSGNVGEIMIVVSAMLAGLPLPLRPLQILYLNIIGDVFPALALGIGRGDPQNMNQPPRHPREPIITQHHWRAIVGYGFLINIAVLAGFVVALDLPGFTEQRAVTVSFLGLSFGRLWHVFNMRSHRDGLFINEITRNPFIWAALALGVLLLMTAAYLPGISRVMGLVRPGPAGWSLILAISFIPLIVGQAIKMARRFFNAV